MTCRRYSAAYLSHINIMSEPTESNGLWSPNKIMIPYIKKGIRPRKNLWRLDCFMRLFSGAVQFYLRVQNGKALGLAACSVALCCDASEWNYILRQRHNLLRCSD